LSPTLTSHLTSCPLSIVGLSLAIFTSIGTGDLQESGSWLVARG
jgi:hypothetical protein